MALRAAFTAAPQAAILLAPFLFLAAAEALADTTLPALFFLRSDFLSPPEVFSLVSRKTEDFARLPLAMTDFFIAILRIFMEAIFFMAIFFMDILAIFIIFAMVGREGGFD